MTVLSVGKRVARALRHGTAGVFFESHMLFAFSRHLGAQQRVALRVDQLDAVGLIRGPATRANGGLKMRRPNFQKRHSLTPATTTTPKPAPHAEPRVREGPDRVAYTMPGHRAVDLKLHGRYSPGS
ncbi:MAG: hypothetical protein QGH33_03290 [Pirellulaceae bacterium]|nr:hypothetical protein [Pirellulaceae bacterium]